MIVSVCLSTGGIYSIPACGEWVMSEKEMTVKHHDGFCLFDSAYTDYKATNTKAGRDLVSEFVAACRQENMRIGFIFRLLTGPIRTSLSTETGSIP